MLIYIILYYRLNGTWNKYKALSHIEDGNDTWTATETRTNVFLKRIYKKSAEKRAKKDELECYLDIGIEDIEDGNLLSYWRNNSQRWPTLALMARDYLTIPSTSAASERSFSVGRDTIGLNRHSLQSTTIEASVTLRSWLRSGLFK